MNFRQALLSFTQSIRGYFIALIAAEVSTLTKYCDELIQVAPLEADVGALHAMISAPLKRRCVSVPDLTAGEVSRVRCILLNGNLNHSLDIEEFLSSLVVRLGRSDRIIAILYNPYLGWLYRLLSIIGVRTAADPSTYITATDLKNIAKLSDLTVVRVRQTCFFPFRFFGIGTMLNSVLPALPGVRYFGLAWVVTLRPENSATVNPSLSIIIPACNERGNIEAALKRLPHFPCWFEILFVEGHSNDGTWEEMQRVVREYGDRFSIQILRQSGRGKGDAVRCGCAAAKGELLTILDSDLTMPPELLIRFYRAWCSGKADFINGNRLVYPMEGEAMRFLNWLGNIFFSKSVGLVLDTYLGDTLCGTKLFARRDYQRFVRWREEFGDFDPFGDFELLFPAAVLGLGILDVPIRYERRRYGQTKIRRFRHGLMLLSMTWIGYLRIKLGSRPITRC